MICIVLYYEHKNDDFVETAFAFPYIKIPTRENNSICHLRTFLSSNINKNCSCPYSFRCPVL